MAELNFGHIIQTFVGLIFSCESKPDKQVADRHECQTSLWQVQFSQVSLLVRSLKVSNIVFCVS